MNVLRQDDYALSAYSCDGRLDILATIDVDDWLSDRTEHNEWLTSEFCAWTEENGKDDSYHSALEFAKKVKNGKGVYGDGDPFVVNTYNGECMLSGVLQYVYWQDEEGVHLLLERHLGGDPRGGYGPVIGFDCTDSDGTAILDNARATIYCGRCDSHWDTDDGYHWIQDCEGETRGIELQDLVAVDDKPDYPAPANPKQGILPIELPKSPAAKPGPVWVEKNGTIHCPFCGGILNIAPWPAG